MIMASITELAGGEKQKGYSLKELAERKPQKDNDVPLIKRMMSIGGAGLWKGLGLIVWPYERIGYTIATPAATALEARKETLQARGQSTSFGNLFRPRFDLTKEEATKELQALGTGMKAVGKAWIPGADVPKEVKTYGDFWDGYYESVTGEKAPGYYSKGMDMATSFLVDPMVFGKLLQGISKTAKLTGIPQKIAQARLPEWQKGKLIMRAKMGARTEQAAELGKSVGGKDIKRLAQELTKQTGKKITPEAVKLRIGQIIKGGITTKPQLAEKANPIIAEFEHTTRELQNLGILGKETYLTKLPKKRVAALMQKKIELVREIEKLKEVPYQKTLLKLVEKLTPDVNRQKRLVDKFIDVAIKAERRGKKLVTAGDDFIDAAIEVSTGSPLAKKITTLMDFAPGDKRLTILGKKILSLEKMDRASRNKAATEILKQAATINPKVSQYVNQTLNDILKIASQIEDSKIIGKAPLLRKIGSMQRRFPGKASKIEELQTNIDDIARQLKQSDIAAGGLKYMPRMYTSKEVSVLEKQFYGWSPQRIRAHYAKQRQPIPFEVRKMMGEIKEPAYPVMKRLIQEGADIETGKLFEFAAQNPEWTSNIPIPGFKQLGDTKALGALREKWVNPRIYDDVTEIVRTRTGFEQIYDTLIGSWKLGKVVLNPATHFRNKFSNKILLDLSGMGYGEQAKYAIKAFKHYKQNSDEYTTAKHYFARTTQLKGELLDDILKTQTKGSDFSKAINAVRGGVKKAVREPAKMYQHEEFINKFMKYLQQRDQGKSVMDAVQEANKWLFDYGDLTRWEINIARRVMPFYTFPRKALPRVIEAATARPHTIAKYPLIAKMTTQYSLAKLNLTDKDYSEITKVLPEYMRNGSYMLMPYRDNNGDLRFFDWTYILPWGELANASSRGVLESAITNPFFQIASDLIHNKSTWTDREIYKETDTTKEKSLKMFKYFWTSLTPSLAPKGLYWDKLEQAVLKKPSKTGKVRPLPETTAHTLFGLRTQAIDVQEQKKFKLFDKKRQAKEISSKMLDIAQRLKSGNISKDEYTRKRKQYLQQIKEIMKP